MPKRYRQIVRAFFDLPWAILPEKYEQLLEIVDLRSEGGSFTADEIAARIGREHGQSTAQVGGGDVALVNVFGVLSQRMNLMADMSGGTSMEQIGQAVDQAAGNEDISTIVLNFDSPGGNVALVPETANKIVGAAKQKRVIGVVNAQAASAGYWLLAATSETVMTPSGQVGSVGVMSSHRVTEEAQQKAGVRFQVFKLPENKAEGSHGEQLSDEAANHRLELIRTYYDQFVAFVGDRRGIAEATIRGELGRMFTAERALELGMVDRVATLETVLAELGVGQGATSGASSRPAFSLEGIDMNPKLFGALVRAGMCEITANETEAAAALERFFAAKGIDKPEAEEKQIAAILEHVKNPGKTSDPADPPADPPTPPTANSDRAAQIMAAVRLASLPNSFDRLEFATTLIADAKLDLPSALTKIQDEVAKHTPDTTPTRIEFGESPIDNFQATARDAILHRHFGANRPGKIWSMLEQDFVSWKPSDDSSRNHSLQSLPRLAEMCLMQAGMPYSIVSRLHPQQIAKLALGLSAPQSLGIHASDGPSYNVSGMFSNILLDAANVTSRRSYEEVPVTFIRWAREADPIQDFKEVNRIISGEIPDPRAVPEDGEFEETTISDAREKYKLVVWGQIFSMTWQMAVNDQLGEFLKIPSKQAVAMRRKQNKLVYGALKDNGPLADGIALFDDANHNNYTTGAVASYTTAFNTMRRKMAEQTGLNTDTTLDLDPAFVLYPPAIAGDIEQFLRSSSDPKAGGSNPGNANTPNIWEGRLEPVQEAQLGAAQGGSDTGFYHVSSSNEIDTMEYAFLAGLRTPATDMIEAFTSLARKFRIYQAFQRKPLEYRGMQFHKGAA